MSHFNVIKLTDFNNVNKFKSYTSTIGKLKVRQDTNRKCTCVYGARQSLGPFNEVKFNEDKIELGIDEGNICPSESLVEDYFLRVRLLVWQIAKQLIRSRK